MPRSPLRLTLAAAVVSAACSPGSAVRAPDDLRGYRLSEPLPKPALTLTATNGATFDLRRDTEGFVTLVFFGYTNCPDVCPVHLSNLGSVVAGLDPRVAQRIKVVFVTTDPRRDTPPVLRRWLDHFSRGFIGLAGDSIAVARAQESFKLAPAVGEMMAALVTGDTPPVEATPFRLARFSLEAGGGTFVASYLPLSSE